MARYGLTVTEIADALRRSNASISAGDVEEGKRRYVVRTDGELNTPERVAGVVLRSDSDPLSGRLGRVTMGDIATIAYRYKEPVARIRQLGEAGFGCQRGARDRRQRDRDHGEREGGRGGTECRVDPSGGARLRAGLRRDRLH